jgi:hypothetical protein
MTIEAAYTQAALIASTTQETAFVVLHDEPGDFDAVSAEDYRNAPPCALRYFDQLEPLAR